MNAVVMIHCELLGYISPTVNRYAWVRTKSIIIITLIKIYIKIHTGN